MSNSAEALTRGTLDVFEREVGHWPLELVPTAARERLRHAVAALPPFCTGLFLECHLASEERTDVAARLLPADRDAVLRHTSAPDVWSEFLKAWQNPSGTLASLPAIDVEVDVVAGPPKPFICPSFGAKLLQGNTAFYAPAAFELAMSSLRFLWPALPRSFVDNIERIRDGLPPGAVFYPGWPLSGRGANPGATVRGFLNTPNEALRDALQLLRWGGDVNDVVAIADTLCPARPMIALDFDLTETGITDRLGVGYDVPWVRADDRQLNATLLRLERSGWCNPRRVAGLSQWVAARRPSVDGQWRALTLKVLSTANATPQPKCYLSSFDLG